MPQAWLSIAGLVLDFLGVMLFAREWWTALKVDQQEAELAARKSMLAPNPNMPKPNLPQQAVFDWMRDRQEESQRQLRLANARTARWHFYLTALLLVSAGFLLQLAGAWPGCCAAVGIMPGP